jgi:hypothetical protein
MDQISILNRETHAWTDAVVSLHHFEIYGMIQRIHTDTGCDPFRFQSCTCAWARFTSRRLQQYYCGNFQPLRNSASLGVRRARGTEQEINDRAPGKDLLRNPNRTGIIPKFFSSIYFIPRTSKSLDPCSRCEINELRSVDRHTRGRFA